MKQYIYLFLVLLFYNCNCKKGEAIVESMISMDTLFERKLPVLTFDDKMLQNELDTLVAKEVNCSYYKKDTTCFKIWSNIWYEKDTFFCISTRYSYDIDFSVDTSGKKANIYGCFKYKNFIFFCGEICMEYTNLFYETGDSIKVKNSPFLYEKHEAKMDDSRTEWFYIYKNKKLIEFSKMTCKQMENR